MPLEEFYTKLEVLKILSLEAIHVENMMLEYDEHLVISIPQKGTWKSVYLSHLKGVHSKQ